MLQTVRCSSPLTHRSLCILSREWWRGSLICAYRNQPSVSNTHTHTQTLLLFLYLCKHWHYNSCTCSDLKPFSHLGLNNLFSALYYGLRLFDSVSISTNQNNNKTRAAIWGLIIFIDNKEACHIITSPQKCTTFSLSQNGHPPILFSFPEDALTCLLTLMVSSTYITEALTTLTGLFHPSCWAFFSWALMRLTPDHMHVCVFQEVIGHSVKQAVCLRLYTVPER